MADTLGYKLGPRDPLKGFKRGLSPRSSIYLTKDPPQLGQMRP